MVNTELLTAVADYLEAHPESYDYSWRKCIGGRAIRLAGGRFLPTGEFGAHLLRPTRDDPPEHVRTDGYNARLYGRHVEPFDRAARLCGLTARQAQELFIDRAPMGEGREAGQQAAYAVRRFLEVRGR